MFHAAVQAPVPVAAHRVVWFAPDRPVEGNTIYLLPSTSSDGATECELPTSPPADS
jgi:hypothetical protein